MELNFKEFGQGDPVIILHGLFGMLDNWQTMARKLAKDYTVFIVDQRNHGRSPHSDEMDYSLMAEDLKKFMESKWIFEARIIGHSMGGKTAMQFALFYQEMVKQLAIIDIAPKAYKGNHETIFKALKSVDLDKVEDRKEVDQILKQQIEEVGVRQFLLKNLSRKKEGGYQWKMNLPTIHKSYDAILGQIEIDESYDGQALFVKGENSNYISNEDLPLITEWFPNATLQTVQNAGHWVHAEAPEELHNMLLQFFKNK